MSPRLRFLPPASILRVTPPTVDSTLCRVVFQKNWDVSWGHWVRGKEKRFKPWVFLLAQSTLADNP